MMSITSWDLFKKTSIKDYETVWVEWWKIAMENSTNEIEYAKAEPGLKFWFLSTEYVTLVN